VQDLRAVASADLIVGIEDPRDDDVRTILKTHLAFAREVTPPGHVHALESEQLLEPEVTLFGARRDGVLLGVCALKHLGGSEGELKSMHTVEAARGRGVGRALVEHVLAVAVERGYRDLSLETGTMDAFAPARCLYASIGFVPCPPFGDYTENRFSTCMTLTLDRDL
jgi:putative acetyltransferase